MLVYYGLRPCTSSVDAMHRLTHFKTLALEKLPSTAQRNAAPRSSIPLCEDPILNALDMGSINIFDES
jgi:hypothetical protein